MARGFLTTLLLTLLLFLTFGAATCQVPAHATTVEGLWPLAFEPQSPDAGGSRVFVARTPRRTVRVTRDGAEFLAPDGRAPSAFSSGIRLALAGGTGGAVTGETRERGVSHHLVGERSRWRRNVPRFRAVRAAGVYPGVDAVYYTRAGSVELDFIVAAGSRPDDVELSFTGLDGSRAVVRRLGDGGLRVSVEDQELKLPAPVAYQEVDGRRRSVACSFECGTDAPARIRFTLGAYDRSRPLVIDPIVHFYTRFGGSQYDPPVGVVVDAAGAPYLAGIAESPDLPFTGNAAPAQRNAYVLKLTPDGSAVEFATYLGGSSLDTPFDLAVDGEGCAYVTGTTSSADFPTFHALVPQANPTVYGDGFISKLTPDGADLVFSTMLPGPDTTVGDNVVGDSVAVDAGGNVYVSGRGAPTIPLTHGSAYPSYAGGFVLKISPSGTQALYHRGLGARYLHLAVDALGAAYVTGQAGVIPTTPGSFDPTPNGGDWDAFVLKLSPAGDVVYGTYLGGQYRDSGRGIGVDPSGRVYVSGVTGSPNFPTAHAFQPTGGGSYDAFLTCLTPDGSALVYSTFYGGSSAENPGDTLANHPGELAVEPSGAVWIVGTSGSMNLPEVEPFARGFSGFSGSSGVYVARFAPDGSILQSDCFAGLSGGLPGGVALDPAGSVFVVGPAAYRFPDLNPLGAPSQGDTAIVKISPGESVALLPSAPRNVRREYELVRWEDGSFNEAGFRIERRTGSGPYSVLGTVGTDKLDFRDTGLEVGNYYQYRVTAFNEAGDSPPAESTSFLIPIPINYVPEAVALGNSAIRVRWYLDPLATHFTLRRATNAGTPVERLSGTAVPGVQTLLDETGIQAGQTYTYELEQTGPTARGFASGNRVSPGDPAPSKLAISPARLSLGTVAVGKSRTKKVTLKNAGATPLTLLLGTPPAAPFRVLNDPGVLVLYPRQRYQLEIELRPVQVGTLTSTLALLASDARGIRWSVPITGRAK